MPELPDVEGFRRVFRRHAAGKRVERVHAERHSLGNVSPQRLGRALVGQRVEPPWRWGKWLICPAGGWRLLWHFGMTGELVWSGCEPQRHEHDRVAVELEDGVVRLRDQRRLGGAWLLEPDQDLEQVTGPLGADALGAPAPRFVEHLAGKRGGVKSALMDQATIAGLGNVTVDEILWRARVDPRRRMGDVSRAALQRIEGDAKQVLVDAAEVGHVPTSASWLTSQRGADQPTCPRCDGGLRTPSVIGRTTYLCPACQT